MFSGVLYDVLCAVLCSVLFWVVRLAVLSLDHVCCGVLYDVLCSVLFCASSCAELFCVE